MLCALIEVSIFFKKKLYVHFKHLLMNNCLEVKLDVCSQDGTCNRLVMSVIYYAGKMSGPVGERINAVPL